MENKNKISEFINFNLSKIIYATCFGSISFNGYKLDILKSGVQKYLRRREFNKMIWCVGEIYLFQVYAKNDIEKKSAKAIITNLINRLVIMLDEEILFTECENYLLVRRYIEDFEKVAIELATNNDKLKDIKDEIKKNIQDSKLFDSLTFPKNLEKIYQDLINEKKV